MKKKFDCLEMKARLQREMLAREARGESSATTREEWLESGNDPLAVWWRTLESRSRNTPVPTVTAHDKSVVTP